MIRCLFFSFFFFFNATATTEIYTLSLHDALPISPRLEPVRMATRLLRWLAMPGGDRKSTRLNSSHGSISYAVFCLKKKKNPLTPLFGLHQEINAVCVVLCCSGVRFLTLTGLGGIGKFRLFLFFF